MRKFILLTLFLVLIGTIASCNKENPKDTKNTTTTAPTSNWEPLPRDTVGEIDIMLWSGDNEYYKDLGSKNWTPADITGQNTAAIYAVAKAFKELYPNIKINVFAKSEGPDDGNGTWYQHLSNFKSEHGKWPDIYASTDLAGDIAKGLVADLSVFADDPMYQSFNPSIMKMMNYYGFQAGLPQYLLPWGVYVNKELAINNNITVPKPDWDLDDYTRFITSADNETFFGAMDANPSFINTGTNTIHKSLYNYSGTGDYVNLNSNEVIEILENYFEDWANNSIWPLWDGGQLTQEFLDSIGWWSYTAFRLNKLLTLDGDPWMMGDGAHPNPLHWGAIQSQNWDIYPRPATDYVGNTVGVVLDPLAIHNYATDDGNTTWSEEELLKLKIAYTFATFWVGDTRAWQARADQQFTDSGVLKTAMNDSFPLVTGPEFDKQMAIWYSVDIHQRFADKDKMPGFQEVVRLFEAGEVWDVSDKAYPYRFTNDSGERQPCMYEWLNFNNADIVGVTRTDPAWLDNVKQKLPEWNRLANERFQKAIEELKNGLKEYYGYTDADFQ